jgi:glycerophosphoryl diester phosphodiesterase
MRNTRTRLFGLLLAAVLSGTAGAEDGARDSPYIVAHRGLLQYAPENTLANFRACLELRLGFEFDVERTQDGHLVCIHDSTVDRTTNGKGKVNQMTLAQIQSLDAGSWFGPEFAGERVPTIEQVLELIAEYRDHDVLVAVDLKAADVEREVTQLALKHKILHRLLFIGRSILRPTIRHTIRETAPAANTAAVANTPIEFSLALEARDANWVYVRYLASSDQVKSVHATKKRTFIAGVTVSGNVPDNWRLANTAGIDAILTDHPLKLRALLRSQ